MFVSQDSPVTFRGFTLVIPAVAVGNVGQLAVDLIVSTLNMSRVGYIHTDCLIPMAGNNPYVSCKEDAEELHTPAEVYTAAELQLAVLQIRAPVIKTKSKKFRQLLVSWIKASGFSRTVVLSSSHAYQRDDQQLQGTPLRYLATPSLLKVSADALNELGWREMERVPPFPGVKDADAEQRLWIPGGGVTKGLYTDRGTEQGMLGWRRVPTLKFRNSYNPLYLWASSEEDTVSLWFLDYCYSFNLYLYSCTEDLPLAVLLLFCSEGDNVPDAFTLVNHLNDWLHLLDSPSQQSHSKWKIPTSWSLLFGSGIPPALF